MVGVKSTENLRNLRRSLEQRPQHQQTHVVPPEQQHPSSSFLPNPLQDGSGVTPMLMESSPEMNNGHSQPQHQQQQQQPISEYTAWTIGSTDRLKGGDVSIHSHLLPPTAAELTSPYKSAILAKCSRRTPSPDLTAETTTSVGEASVTPPAPPITPPSLGGLSAKLVAVRDERRKEELRQAQNSQSLPPKWDSSSTLSPPPPHEQQPGQPPQQQPQPLPNYLLHLYTTNHSNSYTTTVSSRHQPPQSNPSSPLPANR